MHSSKRTFLAFCLSTAIGSMNTASFAGITLVVDNKAYEASEIDLPDCSTEVEFGAMKFTLNAAYGIGVNTAHSACVATCMQTGHGDCDSFCKNDIEQQTAIKKKALSVLFSTVRRYPPHSKSEFCAQGRMACEDKCNAVGVSSEKTCAIECNQYETYFKK